MRALLIGGTGFIGPHVASSLAELGHQVAVVHRGRTLSPNRSGVVFSHANCEDGAAIAAIAGEFNTDVVIDMIAMTADRTAHLLDALRGRIARYVLVSSIDVYKVFGALRRRETAGQQNVPLVEEAPLRESRFLYRGDKPRPSGDDLFDHYDKIPIEEMVRRRSGLQWTILRLPFIYGPEDHQKRFSSFIWRASEARRFLPIETKTAHWRATYAYVENAAAAIALAATHADAAYQVFNLGEEHAFTQREWATAICRALGGSTEIREVDAATCPPHLLRHARLFDPEVPMVVDSALVRSRLRYSEKVGRDEALRRTIEGCLKAGRPRNLLREYRDEDRMLRGGGFLFAPFRWKRKASDGEHRRD